MKKEKCLNCLDDSEAWNESWALFKEVHSARPLPAQLEEVFIEEQRPIYAWIWEYRWTLAAACAAVLMLMVLPFKGQPQKVQTMAAMSEDLASYELSQVRSSDPAGYLLDLGRENQEGIQ